MSSKRSRNEVEVVITVPEPLGAQLTSRFGVRTTLGVLTELLASARQHVVIAAPFIQGAEGLHAGPLGMALIAALKRGVRVDLISTGASLAGLDLRSLRDIAGARFRSFQPRDNVEDPRRACSPKLGPREVSVLRSSDRQRRIDEAEAVQ